MRISKRTYKLPGLRDWRKERGYTMRQVSQETGIAMSTLSQLETGKRSARLRTAEQLAYVLAVPVKALVRPKFDRNDISQVPRMMEHLDEMCIEATLLPDGMLMTLYAAVTEEAQKRNLFTHPIPCGFFYDRVVSPDERELKEAL